MRRRSIPLCGKSASGYTVVSQDGNGYPRQQEISTMAKKKAAKVATKKVAKKAKKVSKKAVKKTAKKKAKK